VSGVPQSETGLVSALLNVGQQIGGSLGLAIMVNVSSAATKSQLAAGVPAAVAITSGYSRAFEVASGIGLLACVLTLAFVLSRPPAPARVSPPSPG